ncbi:N2227-domain-containing protein [Pyrrhoderma noxium]|uniref:carnosine N-methyltransferase n=1 Tax=Pyrrhoderma noxium TaxID=2282107 RepID=A0A286UFA3_9AGAM|nr:N2227-domain-containing protein [Pyrrhoderma noxium]
MPPLSEDDTIEEERHFMNVLQTFRDYTSYSLSANNRRRKDLHTLPLEDKKLLEEIGWKKKLSEIDDAIVSNGNFVKQMIMMHSDMFSRANEEDGEDGEDQDTEQAGHQCHGHDHGHDHSHGPSHHSHSGGHSHSHNHDHDHHPHSGGHDHSHDHDDHSGSVEKYRPTEFDMNKLRSTLKQLVREWSEEGKEEREASFAPIKDALVEHFKNVPESERSKLHVLVPGVGLGRLAYDVAMLGFSCQGNEFSHYMLIASYFILNRTKSIHEHTIYPYVHSLSNIQNRETLLKQIKLPDALPSAIPKDVRFSLVAGDFEEVYGDYDPDIGLFDAILTCFFIDTAKNFLNYLRIINKRLSAGGVWINLGPLLWHWENNTTNDPSIELDLEEVKELCKKLGFKLENERTIQTNYANNSQSMLGYTYQASFWTATKNLNENSD